MTTTTKRIMAIVVCLIVLTALFVSSACMASANGHECLGKCCSTCSFVSIVERYLQSFVALTILAFLAYFTMFLMKPNHGFMETWNHVRTCSLVSWKIRLNN